MRLKNKTFTTKLSLNEALKIELKTAKICSEMEQNGFPLDVAECNKQISELQERIDWVDHAVLPFIPPTPKQKGTVVTKIFKMNGDYTKQVLDWLDEVRQSWIDSPATRCTPWEKLAPSPDGEFCRVEWEPINLGSSQQVNKWLLANGWQPTEWNYKKDKRGKEIKDEYGRKIKTSPKLSDDSLEELEELGQAGRLIAYRRKCTHKRNQIQGFLRNMREDGTVPSKVNTLGAATRRMQHSIIANVPAVKEGQFWKPMRKVFYSGHDDYVVVGADADQCQVRGLAHYMEDEEFIHALLYGKKSEGTDLHSLNAKRAGVSRDHAKNVFYGYLFGAGAAKTASQIGCTIKEAERIRKKFEAGLSALKKLNNKLIAFHRANGYITGLDGVPIYAESEHMLLVYLLQNFEVVLMKVALCYAYDRIKKNNLDARIATIQHDEMQFICHKKDEDKLKELLEQSFIDAGVFINSICPIKGEAKSGPSWYYSH